ncbi:uncharacterized protein CIMG_12685 [Coccidioides immitis RS]|uniref:Uncharacterized protein n=1 Tax=Coccidioides immitis (strain RS) TaxID=246410 RepID=A0A0D8JUR3_COCIM|nr:uncharacterized protein CIMG_12685 [Coccidioides immitis RS]KJF60018.1 hypothetical protein CIMG_12685 [Coccidioides immitis RS]
MPLYLFAKHHRPISKSASLAPKSYKVQNFQPYNFAISNVSGGNCWLPFIRMTSCHSSSNRRDVVCAIQKYLLLKIGMVLLFLNYGTITKFFNRSFVQSCEYHRTLAEKLVTVECAIFTFARNLFVTACKFISEERQI